MTIVVPHSYPLLVKDMHGVDVNSGKDTDPGSVIILRLSDDMQGRDRGHIYKVGRVGYNDDIGTYDGEVERRRGRRVRSR
jgi:hypothetical protein